MTYNLVLSSGSGIASHVLSLFCLGFFRFAVGLMR